MKPMRRQRQQLNEQETQAILERGLYGVLSLNGDPYLYGVPLNYIFCGDRLYFHCAKEGLKLDLIRENPKASFCVVDRADLVAEEYTTYFSSAMVFGNARIVEDERELLQAIKKFAIRFAPGDSAENRKAAIDKDWAALCMFALEIESMTGKQAIELVDEA